ncbi:MAG TPA: FapA family protein [Marinagarivorans sp.]
MAENSPKTREDSQAPSYRLHYDQSAQVLIGIVESKATTFVSREHLKPRIKALGCEQFYFPDQSLEQFLQKLKQGKTGQYTLAERRDASIYIRVATDKLSARAQTESAYGGAPLTIELIREAIKTAQIAGPCIDKAQIAKLVSSAKSVDLTIAHAILPIHGQDAKLVPLVKSTLTVMKDTDNKSTIDQREVFDFVVVEQGQALMQRIPATDGTSGVDVTGGAIKANAGANKAFAKPFVGVELNPTDSNILQATIKGHPVISATSVRVDPVMTIQAVDIHSGNIHYDGSLYVKQDINSGYRIEVTGDVVVKGSIYQACIEAGGNIIAGGGVHAKTGGDEPSCKLSAKGDIQAKFFHQCHVHSQASVHAREYIMQCQIQAASSINAGQEGGKGAIIGGTCRAGQQVRAKVLGNDAYIPTKIIVGSQQHRHPEIHHLKTKIKRRHDEKKQLASILHKIQAQDAPIKVGQTTLDKARKIEETLLLIEQQITTLENLLAAHLAKLPGAPPLQVVVNTIAYLNVHITIDGESWKCTEEKRRFKISLIQQALQVGPLS